MRAATAQIGQDRPLRRRSVVPTTSAGRWAVRLALTCLTLFVASSLAAAFVVRDGVSSLWEWLLMLALFPPAMLTGLAVVPTALFAIVRRAERSLLVWLMLAPGAFAIFFVIGELIGHE